MSVTDLCPKGCTCRGTDDRRIRLYVDRQLFADDLAYADVDPNDGRSIIYQGKTYGLNGADRQGSLLILHCFGPLDPIT